MRDAVKMHNHFRTVWKERKLIVVEAVEAISDGMNKKTSVVMSEMGIETGTAPGTALDTTHTSQLNL